MVAETGLISSDWLCESGGEHGWAGNEDVLKSKKGYLKVALHEIGHAMGLDHTPSTDGRGSSVMNNWGRLSIRRLAQSQETVPLAIFRLEFKSATGKLPLLFNHR